MPMRKRQRAANFCEEEKLRFVRLLQEKGDVILNKVLNKAHDARTNKLKEETWNLICQDHNSSGSIMRNTYTLKKLWQKLKSDAKTYNAAARQQVRGTGGGPCFKSSPNPVLELVLEMTGRGSSGISGVSDCDSDVIPENKLRKRWRYLRDQFAVELGKIPPSGSGDEASTVSPKWTYFKSLLFLKPVVKARTTTGRLTRRRSSLVETPISLETDNDDVKDPSLPLKNISPSLKRRRPNLSVVSLHGERYEPARAKKYSTSLAEERLRCEKAKTELVKLKIKQEIERHNLKIESERKLQSLKVQILETIARKIEDAAQVDANTIKIAFSRLGEESE